MERLIPVLALPLLSCCCSLSRKTSQHLPPKLVTLALWPVLVPGKWEKQQILPLASASHGHIIWQALLSQRVRTKDSNLSFPLGSTRNEPAWISSTGSRSNQVLLLSCYLGHVESTGWVCLSELGSRRWVPAAAPAAHGFPCVSGQPLPLQLPPPEETVLSMAWIKPLVSTWIYQLSGICVLMVSNWKHALFYALIHSLSLVGTQERLLSLASLVPEPPYCLGQTEVYCARVVKWDVL